MGNDQSGGHALNGGPVNKTTRRGPVHYETAEERQKRIAQAEKRMAKGKPTKTTEQLKRERWEKYKNIGKPTEIKNEWADKVAQDNATRAQAKYLCRLCKLPFNEQGALADHMDMAHGVSSPQASSSGSSTSSKRKSPKAGNVLGGSSKSFECPMCQRSFESADAVSLHFDSHGSASAQAKRELRAQLVQQRLNKKKSGKSAKERKNDTWEKYKSIDAAKKAKRTAVPSSPVPAIPPPASSAAPSSSPVQYTPEELAAAQRIREALGIVKQNDADIAAASTKMMRSILSKLVSSGTENEKFRKIKLNNAKVQAKIVHVGGAMEFLQNAGFRVVTLPVASGDLEEYLFNDCTPDALKAATYALSLLTA